MNKLTPKQEMFCHEYLIDLNGTKAATRAGYSAKTAQKIATENQRKPDIQARISELMKEREKRIDRDGDEVLKRLWEVADLKVAEDVGRIEGGKFITTDSQSWTEATKRVVRSVKSTRVIRRVGKEEIESIESSVKAPEVMPALIELMKYHGLSSDFNQAIACMRKYGLWVMQDEEGKWFVEDKNV